jgi:mono/diheme cytochrome c family protein
MQGIRRAIGSLGVMMFTMACEPAWAQDAGHSRAGLALAQQICSECHAVGKTDASSPNAAAPRFERIANTPGMTGMALSAALQTSHRTMPNIMLNTGELSDIVSYILTLKQTN